MNEKKVALYEVIKSLSYALDLISGTVVGHHEKVAYITYQLTGEMGLQPEDRKTLIITALIHDIGVFYLDQTFADLRFDSKSNLHAEVGYRLLENYFPLSQVSRIIRYHHDHYTDDRAMTPADDRIFYLAQIIKLSDRIAVLINQNEPVLNQRDKIKTIIFNRKERFIPEGLDAFERLADKEYFWLDSISKQAIEEHLDQFFATYVEYIDYNSLINLCEVFSHIIDFRSPFTATHTQGVAVVAEALAKEFDFPPEKCVLMKVAGYLHDIGKLSVSLNILDKPGKLTRREWDIMKAHTYHTYRVLAQLKDFPEVKEWAAYHHENLQGTGYPFHIPGEKLTPGARMMAVADIFTAITEDRPYRSGMSEEQVRSIFQNMIDRELIDKKVVQVLLERYDYFDQLRADAQAATALYYRDFKQKIEDKKTEKTL